MIVSPPLGLFASLIVPPCCEITWRAIVSPSPVPPVPRLRDVEPPERLEDHLHVGFRYPGPVVIDANADAG
jgi:hypothetical protein